MTDYIISLNIGSSSIKYALYEIPNMRQKVDGGQITRLGQSPIFESDDGATPYSLPKDTDHRSALKWMIEYLDLKSGHRHIVAAGHRVVHGGVEYGCSQIIDETVFDRLEALCPLAPTHQPYNLMGIRVLSDIWPDMPQVACFDTSFHRSAPRMAQLYALPYELTDEGIIRFGFHGLSYEYIASSLPDYLDCKANGKVIALHLGHGCSMCGLLDLKSQDTTMGFSALGGLMMGKRCGDIDPGVLLHILREKSYSIDELEALLSKQSGLLGVSGLSDDMRDLLTSDDRRAAEAVDLFVYKICQEVGRLAVTLEGVDALVFTGGIGENSAEIRQRVIKKLSWMNVDIDETKNSLNQCEIHSASSDIDVLVLKTDEEQIIAKNTYSLCDV